MSTPDAEIPADSGHPEIARLKEELEAARARFRSTIQHLADGIMIVDEDGVIRFANDAALELLDRDRDALIDSPFGFPLVMDESTEIDVVREGEPRVAELRVVEGEWEGEAAWIASLRDVTAGKESEDQARELAREQVARAEAEEAKERARFLSEAAGRLSSTLDLQDTLEHAVALATEQFADYAVIDLIDGDQVRRISAAREPDVTALLERAEHHPLRPEADTPQSKVLEDCQPLRVEEVDDAWLDSAAQSPAHRELLDELAPRSLLCVPLETGRACVGLLSAARRSGPRFRDQHLHLAVELGRHVAMAIENASLYRDAEAANEAKANFLSVMSHELRTPLSAIIGYADLIDQGVAGEVEEQQRKYLGRIRASSNHLLQIIEEILAFAGAETGNDEVEVGSLTLGELVEGSRTVAESLAADTELEFRVVVEDGDTVLRTDERKVRQILLNLISNALKFTEEGSVELRTWIDDDRAIFEVEDTGVGIPEDRRQAIFERFSQVEDALTRKAGGTGLGLAVARSYARLLGGSLSVESEDGTGSTFRLEIPRMHG